MTAVRDWIAGHSRTIARMSVGAAIALLVAYTFLLYLDRSAGLELYGFPGLGELGNLLATTAGALIVARHPRNALGWMLVFLALAGLVNSDVQLYSVLANRVHHGALPGGVVSAWLGSWTYMPGLSLLITMVLLLFPDGRLPSPRWRWVAWGSAVAVVLGPLGLAVGAIPNSPHFAITAGGSVSGASRLFDHQELGLMPFLFSPLCLAGLVVRFRRSTGEERQQLKWFTYGGGLLLLGFSVAIVSVFTTPGDSQIPAWAGGSLQVAVMAIPIAIGIAVLKYRLYDIDVVISRTLVYGALAAFITAVYVGIVVGVGTLVGSGGQPNLVLSIIATAIVAVAFQPVRERLQKIANRLVYGKRATPYEVLSQFSERVAESYAADDVLPRMARVLAEGTGAERAEVWLRHEQMLRQAASWPVDANPVEPARVAGDTLPTTLAADRMVEVRHQGELLGALTVTKRRGESLTPVEEKLLTDLASQAGLVLKNVGLSAELLERLEDLRASRQRLVAAQDEERRRLERNLHDGAQQNLVALKVKLGLAEAFAEKDPEKAKQLLGEIKSETDEALETLRDLARGIYPPLLADKGLGAALKAQARKAALPVEVMADGVGRYPQEIEAALYFCCLEALQNIAKYAGATHATVGLSAAGEELAASIVDDGHGFDPATSKKGSGLQNMEDRLNALGGTIVVVSAPGLGTTITASLPVRAATAVG